MAAPDWQRCTTPQGCRRRGWLDQDEVKERLARTAGRGDYRGRARMEPSKRRGQTQQLAGSSGRLAAAPEPRQKDQNELEGERKRQRQL